mmetsp:Transcript_2046/g.5677  ORF Transcript_2046/g.5677 Transcript_2046/m.5677 type:complete len:81 (+) Transcript_2046:47-289(+)
MDAPFLALLANNTQSLSNYQLPINRHHDSAAALHETPSNQQDSSRFNNSSHGSLCLFDGSVPSLPIPTAVGGSQTSQVSQ